MSEQTPDPGRSQRWITDDDDWIGDFGVPGAAQGQGDPAHEAGRDAQSVQTRVDQ